MQITLRVMAMAGSAGHERATYEPPAAQGRAGKVLPDSPIQRQATDLNFDADVGDRIMAVLGQTDMQSQLEPAARLAGQQLELMKPGVMIPTPKGLWAGAVADVPLGEMVFVLADHQRVTTCYCGLVAGATALTAINEMVADAEAVGAPEIGWDRASAGIIHYILERGGAKPGESCPNMGNAIAPLLGSLFSAIPAEGLAGLATRIDLCTAAAICPVLVGLIGPATSGRPDYHSMAWPMLLPLAPYLEWITHKADPVETEQ